MESGGIVSEEAKQAQALAGKHKAARASRQVRPLYGPSAFDLIRNYKVTSADDLIKRCDKLDEDGVLCDAQVFGIKNHRDLKEGLTAADVFEMKEELGSALLAYRPQRSQGGGTGEEGPRTLPTQMATQARRPSRAQGFPKGSP